MESHPLADLFPLMSGEAFDNLKRDIQEQGLNHPIVISDGKILDGRTRFRACQDLGIEPTIEHFNGGDPLAFVISENIQRRHLDSSQLAMIATKIATLPSGRPRRENGDQSLITQVEVAQRFGVSQDVVKAARVVQRKGSAQLQKAVEQGKIGVTVARKLVDLSPKDQADIALEQDEKERRRKIKEGKQRAKEKAALEKQHAKEAQDFKLAAPLVKLSGVSMGPYSLAMWKVPKRREMSHFRLLKNVVTSRNECSDPLPCLKRSPGCLGFLHCSIQTL